MMDVEKSRKEAMEFMLLMQLGSLMTTLRVQSAKTPEAIRQAVEDFREEYQVGLFVAAGEKKGD